MRRGKMPNNSETRNPRIGTQRTLLGLAQRLTDLDLRIKQAPDDLRLRETERRLLESVRGWAKLNAIVAPEIVDATSEATRNIASILTELKQEWRKVRRSSLAPPQPLRDFVIMKSGESRFEDRLYEAASELASSLANINKSKTKFRLKHPALWAMDRIRSALTTSRKVHDVLGDSAIEGGSGPVAAAREVVADVLGRSREGIIEHAKRHRSP